MAQQFIGSGVVFVDSVLLAAKSKITADLMVFTNESVLGLGGYAGYVRKAKVAFIEIDAILLPTFPFDKLANDAGFTVTASFDTGRVATLSDAQLIGSMPIVAPDEAITLRFEGGSATWI